MKKKIILSNGFRNFHLFNTANELKKRKLLAYFICGLYPTSIQKEIIKLSKVKNFKKITKYLQRDVAINDSLVFQNKVGELINLIGIIIDNNFRLKKLSQLLIKFAINLYIKNSIKKLSVMENNKYIYHFRSGYGGKSIEIAKKKGYLTICDHSIVNPRILENLIQNKKAIPNNTNRINDIRMKMALYDIERSDIILVNSDFVKKTFIGSKFYNKIKVSYLGVENSFLKKIKFKRKKNNNLKILFAGSIDIRKGIDDLNSIFNKIKNLNIEFNLAGPLNFKIKKKYKSFFNHKKVNYLGVLNKTELAKSMNLNDVFLFPSKAEGSARVIFEAMASGCTIITTPNSGSIVKNNINGFIVKPNEPLKVYRIIIKILKNPKILNFFSINNRNIIKTNYLQKHYGDHLVKIYNFEL